MWVKSRLEVSNVLQTQMNTWLSWEGPRGLVVRMLWVWTHGPSATLWEGVVLWPFILEDSRPAGDQSGDSGGLAP